SPLPTGTDQPILIFKAWTPDSTKICLHTIMIDTISRNRAPREISLQTPHLTMAHITHKTPTNTDRIQIGVAN
ncbi:MAG: hypothetical protein WCS75_14740, partial [Sphingomonas sp.]